MELKWVVASFLHFFSVYRRVKFFNELADVLWWHWELRNFLCHCLDKSQAPFINNKTPCNNPGGNVSNLGNNLSNKNRTMGRAGVHFRFCSFKFSHLIVFLPYRSVGKFDFGGNFSYNITILAVNFNASYLQTYKPE